MHLAPCLKFDTYEIPINRIAECGYVNLGYVHICLVAAVNAGNHGSIDDGKIELRRQQTIDATLHRTSVNKGFDSLYAWDWSISHAIVGIKSYIDNERWAKVDEEILARICSGLAVETTVSFGHGAGGTSRRLAEKREVLQLF
jgi:hypothetical protein